MEKIGLFQADLTQADDRQPVYLYNPSVRDYVACVGLVSETELRVVPTSHAGSMYDNLDFVSSNLAQSVSENMPIYRRNVINYLPSVRFTPEQFVAMDEECLLQSRMSGPVQDTCFTWFCVAKGYANDGSSPWPLFTALDTQSGFAFQLQVVVEQYGDDEGFEPRWKVLCGKAGDKTTGVDPKMFHIIVVQKTGRLVRLFVDGCPSTGLPAAEFIIEQNGEARINYTMFGLDANGTKFFDGELAEFLAYSEAIPNQGIDQVGKYLMRKYDLPWTWQKPKRSDKLDDFLAHQQASVLMSQLRSSTAGAQSAVSGNSENTEGSVGGVMAAEGGRKIDALLAALPAPEAAQVALDTLSNLSRCLHVQTYTSILHFHVNVRHHDGKHLMQMLVIKHCIVWQGHEGAQEHSEQDKLGHCV